MAGRDTKPSCTVSTAAGPCPGPVTLTRPTPLCDQHKLEVALAVVPELLAGALVEVRAQQYDGTRPLPEAAAHIVASAAPAALPEADQHSTLVYFLANGGRVKIGHTRGLYARIRALSLREDAVLLLLHGGPSLERALHQKFQPHRIGTSEWFELTPTIVRFIAGKATPSGARRKPHRVSERISREEREQLRDEAEQWTEATLLRGENPSAAEIGRRYDKGETWGGDRIRAVRARLGDDTTDTP
ncbi:GIY-YIG nuclease family protein [Streptomyces lincolnensis]|uniref:GIY-YIG nuclease family protein n=1 Tax=Streptomyces lincolnensis TaxID=1915 RepID=UPI0037D2ED49